MNKHQKDVVLRVQVVLREMPGFHAFKVRLNHDKNALLYEYQRQRLVRIYAMAATVSEQIKMKRFH